jgi:DNA (cytosine-5)-methyltransferase 1
MADAGRWPKAARFDGKSWFQADVGPFPIWKKRKPLHEFLRYPADPLSVRATAGFLNRTEKSQLHFVEGFRERVRRHLERMRKLDRAFAVAAE